MLHRIEREIRDGARTGHERLITVEIASITNLEQRVQREINSIDLEDQSTYFHWLHWRYILDLIDELRDSSQIDPSETFFIGTIDSDFGIVAATVDFTIRYFLDLDSDSNSHSDSEWDSDPESESESESGLGFGFGLRFGFRIGI